MVSLLLENSMMETGPLNFLVFCSDLGRDCPTSENEWSTVDERKKKYPRRIEFQKGLFELLTLFMVF